MAKAVDPYKLLSSTGKRKITLQKICSIMGIDVPKRFDNIKNDVQNCVVTREKYIKKGCYFILLTEIKNLIKVLDRLVASGVKVIFIDEKLYLENDIANTDYPVISVPDIIDNGGRFFNCIKSLRQPKTVGVTGTVGKTTTMNMIRAIIPEDYEAFLSTGNMNSFYAVSKNITNNLKKNTKVYIQEVGANNINSVRKSASMLRVDAFILLNVLNHHSNKYGSVEAIFNDKVSFEDYMADDNGVAIVNYDDERIAAHDFKCDVISFGVNTEEEVTYKATNVRQNRDLLEFDVVYGEKKTPIRIHILGEQNVYNALAAFSLCKWLGIDEETIVKGFYGYQSDGIRQNYKNIGKYEVLMDSYNCSEDSLIATLKSAQKYEISPGSRKIAVISGENRLSEETYEQETFELGKKLDTEGIDYVICIGPDGSDFQDVFTNGCGRALYEGVLSTGRENVLYVKNAKELEKELSAIIKPGDFLIMKGQEKLYAAPVVDKLLGSDFASDYSYYVLNSKKITTNDFIAKRIDEIEAVEIKELKAKRKSKVSVPDKIKDVPVYRLGTAFAENNTHLKEISLGSNVSGIGKHAFKNCTNLRSVTIPSNVKMIGDGAFSQCVNLQSVVIEEGVKHIGEGAFKNCCSLKNVTIPDTVEHIAENAFEGCLMLGEKSTKDNMFTFKIKARVKAEKEKIVKSIIKKAKLYRKENEGEQ